VLIKTVEMPTPHGLGLKDSLLYICQQENGLSIYNVKDPAKPVLRSTISNEYFNDVIIYDDLLICYVQSGVKYHLQSRWLEEVAQRAIFQDSSA
jgi:hypothetical protein